VRLAVVGIAIGGAGGLAATRVMKGLLFGVTSADPVTFATVALMLLLVTLVASYIPAWRATRVDPIIALRCE
jgi:ABC-type antimicrobial peptide transport system permease subunit